MKKLFTLAAVVLAALAINAQTTIFSATPLQTLSSGVNCDGSKNTEMTSAEATISGGSFFAVNQETSSKGFISKQSSFYAFSMTTSKTGFLIVLSEPLQAGDTIAAYTLTNGAGESNARGLWITTASARPSSAPACEMLSVASAKEYAKASHVVESTDDICGKDSLFIWRGTGNSTYFKDLAIIHPAPNTEPVSEVTISGPTECFVGHKITLKATADKPVDQYRWTVNGAAAINGDASNYVFNPTEAGTYSIVCKAKNSFNSDWVLSAAYTVQVNALFTQVDVTGDITWDWTKAAASAIQFTDATIPQKGDTVLLANVEGMNNDADFNSQALLFAGEYAARDGKYCQGSLLKFHTTVSGTLSVEYSNTGNRSKDEDTRILTVNGTKIGEGSLRSDETVTESAISVEGGDVEISSVLKKDESVQYIRIYKIIFTEDVVTAIDNAETEVKAEKVIRNGQLFIEKNGVLYNAQGSVVK